MTVADRNSNLLVLTPDTWYDLLARCSFDHGGRAIAMAPVVVRLRQRPAPHSRQISTWGGERENQKCAFVTYMSTISLHEKTPLRSLFGSPGAGRSSRPERGPCRRPSATIRHGTAIIRSGGKGSWRCCFYYELKLTDGN